MPAYLNDIQSMEIKVTFGFIHLLLNQQHQHYMQNPARTPDGHVVPFFPDIAQIVNHLRNMQGTQVNLVTNPVLKIPQVPDLMVKILHDILVSQPTLYVTDAVDLATAKLIELAYRVDPNSRGGKRTKL